ncbi:glutathione hydrolase 7-like isoform X2 [Rhynchophorus ferrugineus]|uniref:glutathione hydrolase 7-like isoform X2 n=1 Tax=Rhynchophorus ferrugineus TaxID=354439 RepID=UPI003FCC3AF6
MTSAENTTTVSETREDIPLKTGAKQAKWYNWSDDCFNGSKFINIAFGSLTIIITVALLIQIYYGDYQVVPHGSVATDSLDCSRIGTQILKQGGNAVDAAIASTFCLSVVTPHVTGLDAEGQMLIYNHRTRLMPNVIDFSSQNVLSDHMPRLVLGLAYIHQQYGTIPWQKLIEPSVELARKGFVVSRELFAAVSKANAVDLYGRLEPGKLFQHGILSNTLSTIGNISEKELYSYLDSAHNPIQSQGIKSTFHNYDVFVPSLESVGPMLLVNLREIEEYNFTKLASDSIKTILESTLKVYQEFNINDKFHEGTSTNVAVMDLDENYVSLVTGMYSLFGSGEMTSHGYVLDVKKRDKPCTRIPIIMTDSNFICGKRMAFGANGIAQASQLIANLVIGERNATDGIEAPRFYVLPNNTIAIEAHLPKFPVDFLQNIKNIFGQLLMIPEPYYSSNIVAKSRDDLSSHSDSRGGGIASRF